MAVVSDLGADGWISDPNKLSVFSFCCENAKSQIRDVPSVCIAGRHRRACFRGCPEAINLCNLREKRMCVESPTGLRLFLWQTLCYGRDGREGRTEESGETRSHKAQRRHNIPLGGPWLSSEEHCNDSEPETQEISGVIFESCLGCRVTAQGRRACCKHSMGNRSKAERISNNSKHPLWEKSKLGCPLWLLFVWGNLVVFLNQ